MSDVEAGELLLAVLDAASQTTGGDMRLVLARSRGELLMSGHARHELPCFSAKRS